MLNIGISGSNKEGYVVIVRQTENGEEQVSRLKFEGSHDVIQYLLGIFQSSFCPYSNEGNL